MGCLCPDLEKRWACDTLWSTYNGITCRAKKCMHLACQDTQQHTKIVTASGQLMLHSYHLSNTVTPHPNTALLLTGMTCCS